MICIYKVVINYQSLIYMQVTFIDRVPPTLLSILTSKYFYTI